MKQYLSDCTGGIIAMGYLEMKAQHCSRVQSRVQLMCQQMALWVERRLQPGSVPQQLPGQHLEN